MFGIGSRTFYAERNGILFNFEHKRDRDYFITHSNARIISAYEAYKNYSISKAVRVEASCKIGGNKYRKKSVEEWYANKQCNI